MFRLFLLSALVALAAAQNHYQGKSQQAAILSDARYLSGDGTFGAAYQQEDGVEFKEESDQDGNRRGSYSYVDPSGQRRTITYTAGKNGFQATGDHLPKAPPAPAHAAPQAPAYQPQYNNGASQYDDGQYREEYNNPNYNSQPQQYQPQPQQQYQPQPQQYQPQPQYQQNPQGQYSYSFGTPAPPAPQQPYYNPQQYTTTTPAPHRFYPPGKLNLNRTPDGFSYTFNKN